jgi:hypothetical protein
MCGPIIKLSIKTNVSSLNPFSCKIQIFKVRVKVSYFFTKLCKSSAIFHGRTMAMAAMNMMSAGEFLGAELLFKKMSAGGRLCNLQENPPFWVQTIKVRPPDGSNCKVHKRIADPLMEKLCTRHFSFKNALLSAVARELG